MRSSQSQGFRLHFGQHDKAAAGGDRGSVSVRKPSTWTRAAQIQLRRKKGRGDWGAGSPTRSQERASASSRGRRSGPLSPVQSRNSGAAPQAAGRRWRATRCGEDCVPAPRFGSARAEAAAVARAQLPGARIRLRPSSGRAAEAAAELLLPPRRCRCRCSRTARTSTPPSTRPLAQDRQGSLSLASLLSLLSAPSPVSASLSLTITSVEL